jgi:predicted RNase H-like HicB family nuclease
VVFRERLPIAPCFLRHLAHLLDCLFGWDLYPRRIEREKTESPPPVFPHGFYYVTADFAFREGAWSATSPQTGRSLVHNSLEAARETMRLESELLLSLGYRLSNHCTTHYAKVEPVFLKPGSGSGERFIERINIYPQFFSSHRSMHDLKPIEADLPKDWQHSITSVLPWCEMQPHLSPTARFTRYKDDGYFPLSPEIWDIVTGSEDLEKARSHYKQAMELYFEGIHLDMAPFHVPKNIDLRDDYPMPVFPAGEGSGEDFRETIPISKQHQINLNTVLAKL